MMKVLFATYPMAFHPPGGGEIQLLAYKKHLSAFGIEATLFDQWNPRFLEHDIVHFFSCIGGSAHFCAFVKKIGLPLVVSSSLWLTEASLHQYPMDEIRGQLALADKIVANSNKEADALAQLLPQPREKFTTVYNGVDDQFFESVDAQLFREHFGIAGPFILNVANIEPRKNQQKLAEVMKSFPDLKLVIIGHVRDPEYLEQVLKTGGAQVQYLGPLPHDSPLLRSAYKACTLFALPSLIETPGLVALEAAAQGASLLLTSEGCCAEYFGENAVYADPNSQESISQGMVQVLANNHGAKTSTHVEKYKWNKVVGDLAAMYKSMKRA